VNRAGVRQRVPVGPSATNTGSGLLREADVTIDEDRRVALVTPAVQMMADDAVTVPIVPYATGGA
jgi:hypothetical protein